VIVILSLVCQVLADAATLPEWLLWLVPGEVPAAAIPMFGLLRGPRAS